MKVTLIQPTIGRVGDKKLRRPWTLEPLSLAVIAGVTPKDIEVVFYDDRIEDIDYNDQTDLVGISVETSTALRAYEIALHYKKLGIPVIMGGIHPTLLPEEVSMYADVVVSGCAEKLWPQILNDFKIGKLKKFYKEESLNLNNIVIDKSIFRNKKYFPVSLIEFGRGCPFQCDFCDIPIYFNGKYGSRPIENLITDIKKSGRDLFMIVDDNIGSYPKDLYDFCIAIKPLKIKWVTQTSITLANNEELLNLMALSGCLGVLIGFESIEATNLKSMNKGFNQQIPFEVAINRFNKRGMRIYGSFIVGYDHDTVESMNRLVEFAIKQKLFVANFYPLTPIPRTPLYLRLQKEGRLIKEKWWLDYGHRYGDIVFHPAKMTNIEIARACEDIKKVFYSAKNILKRGLGSESSLGNFKATLGYFGMNILTRRELLIKGQTFLGYEKTLLNIINK